MSIVSTSAMMPTVSVGVFGSIVRIIIVLICVQFVFKYRLHGRSTRFQPSVLAFVVRNYVIFVDFLTVGIYPIFAVLIHGYFVCRAWSCFAS